jgi:hypothetical protein
MVEWAFRRLFQKRLRQKIANSLIDHRPEIAARLSAHFVALCKHKEANVLTIWAKRV